MEEYYERKAVSNSSLSWLEISPRYFYKRFNGEIPDKEETDSLEFGEKFHYMLLEPEKFEKIYTVIPNIKFPNSKQKEDFCNFIINGGDPVEGYKNYYSTGTKSAERIQKDCDSLVEETREYVNFKKSSKDKKFITTDDFTSLMECKISVYENKAANYLLEKAPYERKRELEIYFIHEGIECKSKIDLLLLDICSKEAIIVDLKTTSKNVHKFEKAFEGYKYYRQLAFYTMALEYYLKQLGENPKDYSVNIAIIAIQTTGLKECSVYEVSHNHLHKGIIEINDAFSRLKYHFSTGKFDYPMEYYEGEGFVELKCEE